MLRRSPDAKVAQPGPRHASADRSVRSEAPGRWRQPRPAFGLVPWFAFLRRALAFFFLVRFDIRGPRYGDGGSATKVRRRYATLAEVQASTSSAVQVLMI